MQAAVSVVEWLARVAAAKANPEAAGVVCDEALAQHPHDPQLLETRAILLRRAGRRRDCEALLRGLLPRFPDAAWVRAQLGHTIELWDKGEAVTHLRVAVEMAPENEPYRFALIQALEGRRNLEEGQCLEEAYQLLLPLMDRCDGFTPTQKLVASNVLARVCDFDNLERLGDPKALGRAWAEAGIHTGLLNLLSRLSA